MRAPAVKRKKSLKELKLSIKELEKRFLDIADNAGDMIWEVDKDGRYTYVGHASEKILGYAPEEMRGRHYYDFFHPNYLEKLKKNAVKIISKKKPFQNFLNRNVHKDGHTVILETSGVPIINNKGELTGYRGADHDITEKVNAEKKLITANKELLKSNKKLKQLALKDSLTGLYNYRYFEEIIEAELSRTRRYGNPISLILFDIDYFKSINDTYGHKFGDTVLQQLAKQFKKMVRQYDIVIRIGGGEFLILSPGADRQNSTIMANRLLDSIKLFNFGDKKHTIKLKLSGSVASYPDDKLFRGADFVNLADKIINKAKEDGGDRIYSIINVEGANSIQKTDLDTTTDIGLLREKITKLTKQSHQSFIESIFAFAKTIELKDHYTGEHAELTVQYATEIANALGLSKDEIECIKQSAILHDLGKIGISEKILCKKAKLNEREFQEIKKHPQIGVDIIRPIQFLHNLIPLIFYHHERWDGNGYPSGLKGEEIPMGARIIAIADVYQALISDRPYRKAFSQKEALEIIKADSGIKFDPKIVDIFLKILGQSQAENMNVR